MQIIIFFFAIIIYVGTAIAVSLVQEEIAEVMGSDGKFYRKEIDFVASSRFPFIWPFSFSLWLPWIVLKKVDRNIDEIAEE